MGTPELNPDGISVKGCSMIYAPRGQAGEYAPLAANPYRGCGHACAYCLAPDTLVQMADGSTRRIADLRLGQEVIGITRRNPPRRAWNYRYVPSRVLGKIVTVKPAVRVTLANGMGAVCSPDHRWLTERGWKFTSRLTAHNEIRTFAVPLSTPDETDTYRRGYLAGIIRGDGTLRRYDYSGRYRRSVKRSPQKTDVLHQFRLAMNDLDALERVARYLERLGVATTAFAFQHAGGTMPAIRANSKAAFEVIAGLLTPEEDREWSRGWLAGIFDAEGGTTTALRIHNKDAAVLAQIESTMARFHFRTRRDVENENGCTSVRLLGGLTEVARFFNLTIPAIRRKFSALGAALRGSAKIVEVAPLGRTMEMVDITTSTENFIANGMISHNCYVPNVIKMDRAEFDAGAVPREGFTAALVKDARKYQALGVTAQVMLSFTTDPYHLGDTTLTRQVLGLLKFYGMGICTLTKGGSRALRDLDLFRPARDAFASTLTSLDEDFSRKWERQAALPGDRIATLRRFHEAGIFTWVSLEPVLDTEATKEIIRQTCGFVDLFKVGRVNYIGLTRTTDWERFTDEVLELLHQVGAAHYIKRDLQPYLPAGYENVLRVAQHH